MVKAVLFDLDGTLIDTNDLIIQSFKHVFKHQLNIEVADEEIISTFGEPLVSAMEKFDKENAKNLCGEYIKYNEKVHDQYAKCIDGAEDALRLLKGMGIKLAVVTSKRRVTAIRGLKLFNLDKYIDIIVTPEDTNIHKPEGEPVLKACELLDVSPSDAIMVGDSHNDILCGKNAGAKTCLVKYTALSMKNLLEYKPDYVVDSLEEIYFIITNEKIC